MKQFYLFKKFLIHSLKFLLYFVHNWCYTIKVKGKQGVRVLAPIPDAKCVATEDMQIVRAYDVVKINDVKRELQVQDNAINVSRRQTRRKSSGLIETYSPSSHSHSYLHADEGARATLHALAGRRLRSGPEEVALPRG